MKKTKNILHSTRVDIPEKKRVQIIDLLNKSLASTADLYNQLKQAHWNVKGMQFISLHLLFDQIAKEVFPHIDIIAERVTALGGTALGTTQIIGANTQLRNYPVDIFQAKDHLEHLIHNTAILAEHAHECMDATEELDDMATNDVYIDLTRMLEKNLWFLEAHLQK